MINYNVPVKSRWKQRDLEGTELQALIGVRDAVKVNFIPHMLTALALDYALRLCDRAAKIRDKRLLKETRLIRREIDEYARGIMQQIGPKGAVAYDYFLNRFDAEVSSQRYLSMLQLHADASNQLQGVDTEIAGYACLALLLLAFVARLDLETDVLLSKKLGSPVARPTNPNILKVRDACKAIGAKGYSFKPSPQMADWVKIMSNKAYQMADKIISEEEENVKE